MTPAQPLIIFGSALTSREPGDIDVACVGPLTPADEQRVRAWAMERGVIDFEKLPIDAHQLIVSLVRSSSATVVATDCTCPEGGDATASPLAADHPLTCDLGARGAREPGYSQLDHSSVVRFYQHVAVAHPGATVTARLPAPAGVRCLAWQLDGGAPVQIQWIEYWSIPAILRAHGDDVEAALTAWKRTGKLGLYGSMIDVGGAENGDVHGDWDNYVTGLRSLRSAIAHAPKWREILAMVPEGPLLAALAERGPSAFATEWTRQGSSGAGHRLLFGEDGVRQQYPHEIIPYSEAIARLVA